MLQTSPRGKLCNRYLQNKATIVNYVIYDEDPHLGTGGIVHDYCTVKASM